MLEALQNAKTKPKPMYFLIALVNMKIPYVNALDGNIQQARKILATPAHKTIIVNPDLCMGTDTNSPIQLRIVTNNVRLVFAQTNFSLAKILAQINCTSSYPSGRQ